MPALFGFSLIFLCLFANAEANWQLKEKVADAITLKQDLNSILREAGWPEGSIKIAAPKLEGDTNKVTVLCTPNSIHLAVTASRQEWGSTFYYGLQKIGFLFPHPRIQISPEMEQSRRHCGRQFKWQPNLRYRGFHLHTQHPSEWVYGFLMGEEKIAKDMVRWLARNQQNLLQVVLLKTIPQETSANIQKVFELADKMAIHTGLSISYAFGQQRSYTLFNKFEVLLSFLGYSMKERLNDRLTQFVRNFPSDFVTVELGTSEFTKTNENSTLDWLNLSREVLARSGRQLFVKVHASSNQKNADGTNFNFLPARAHKDVGVLPHTVMFYSLLDKHTPVYGRENFDDMRKFTIDSTASRPTIYFPETSYFVAFDIDVPLLLTDYLLARDEDMEFLVRHKVPGQLNFTTGQELGYWLFDWQVALSANREHLKDPLAALRLLGEDHKLWAEILQFQNEHFHRNQLITVLSSSTILDEVGFLESPHERLPVTHLPKKRKVVQKDVEKLKQAMALRPDISGVKNDELRLLLQITWMRMEHAMHVRQAVVQPERKRHHLSQARNVRKSAERLTLYAKAHFSRYPKAFVFEQQDNITSYAYGYGWTAATLHFWKREEQMVKSESYYPWFQNIFNPLRFLL